MGRLRVIKMEKQRILMHWTDVAAAHAPIDPMHDVPAETKQVLAIARLRAHIIADAEEPAQCQISEPRAMWFATVLSLSAYPLGGGGGGGGEGG